MLMVELGNYGIPSQLTLGSNNWALLIKAMSIEESVTYEGKTFRGKGRLRYFLSRIL